MEISDQLTHNKNISEVGGYCTLGDHEAGKTGSKRLLAVIRGIKSKWKQVIGCHNSYYRDHSGWTSYETIYRGMFVCV